MPMPVQTADVLRFLRPSGQFVVHDRGAGPQVMWFGPDPPTEAEIAAAAASPEFAAWLEENGGNLQKTRRKEAARLLTSGDPQTVLLRGIALEIFQSLRESRAKINELIVAVNAATGGSIGPLTNRNFSQVVGAVAGRITAGEAD